MLVKCRKCGSKIDRQYAYKHIHVTQSGNKNMYYCNEEEFNEDITYKKYYNDTRLLVDKILNYTCISNQKNKMITSLYNIGYTPKHVFDCMDHYSDEIIKYMDLKQIENEYGKLRYIFTVVENNIKDFSTRTIISTSKVNVEPEIDIQEDIQVDIKVVSQPKSRRKSLKDRLKEK